MMHGVGGSMHGAARRIRLSSFIPKGNAATSAGDASRWPSNCVPSARSSNSAATIPSLTVKASECGAGSVKTNALSYWGAPLPGLEDDDADSGSIAVRVGAFTANTFGVRDSTTRQA